VPTNLQAAETEAVGQRRIFGAGLSVPGLAWLALLFLTPFYAILAVAMGRPDPIFGQPLPEWNPMRWDTATFTDTVYEVFAGRYQTTALRTIAYVTIACALCLLIGYPVAYFTARRAGRGKALVRGRVVAPFWINYLMRMMAWVNLLSPDGYVNDVLGVFGVEPVDWLAGRHETVILGLTYGYLPFFILPLYAALDRLDEHTIEAARDLGAGPAQAFRRVTLPLSRQGILAGLVIVMLPMFGDYYTPNLLSGSPRTRMIGNDIDQLMNQTASGGAQGASLTLVLMTFVAILMLYYLFSVARTTEEARR
jgi:spermidine/putrescine transport system permease protein